MTTPGSPRALAIALAVALAAAIGCGGSGPRPAAPAAAPAVDERTAKKDAKGVVIEIYQTLGRGRTDSLFSLLSDSVIVFGPRRMDATVTRSDALVALGVVVDAKGRGKQRAQLRSSGVEVVVSQGGHSAWAFDVVTIDGNPLAVTAVLSNTDDLWAVTAASVAETPTGKQVRDEAQRDAIVPPGATAVARIAPGASAAVDKLRRGLLDQRSWGDELASRTDAIVAGPMAGQVARGKQAIKRLFAARLKSNVRAAVSGEIAAATTADGQLAWVSAPITRVADGEEPMPLRIFAVYEKSGADWTMVALHEALAVGEPGSGTQFKKIVPPEPEPEAAPEPRSEAKPETKPKPKPAKAKKSSKPKKK